MAFPPRGMWHRTAVPLGWFSRYLDVDGWFDMPTIEQPLNTFWQNAVAAAVDAPDATLIPVNVGLGTATAVDVPGILEIQQLTDTVQVTKGYMMGGAQASVFTRIRYWDFVNNTLGGTLAAVLSVPRYSVGGFSSDIKGYGCGGFTTGSVVDSSSETLVFASETTAMISGTLSTSTDSTAGFASTTKGYQVGGTAARTEVRAWTLSNDTTAVLGATTPTARGGAGTNVYSPTAGYAPGNFNANSATIDKLTFATETVAAIAGVLNNTSGGPHGVSAGTFAVMSAGFSGAIATRLDFATDTCASTASVTNADGGGTVTQNNLNGIWYNVGNNSGTVVSINFASETRTALTGAATADQNAAGIGVYRRPTVWTLISATDDSTAALGAVGPSAVIEAITATDTYSPQYAADFSATLSAVDTTALNPSSTTSRVVEGSFPQSNGFGYLIGGVRGGTTSLTNAIRRIGYADDAVSTISAVSPITMQYGTPMSAPTKGYCAGGVTVQASTFSNQIAAITYSGETTSTLSATLGNTWSAAAGVGTQTFGYVVGGRNGTYASFIEARTIQKLDYSNDTIATLGTNTTNILPAATGISSNAKGYIAGANSMFAPYVFQSMDKITFSGETVAANATALASAATDLAGNACVFGTNGFFTRSIKVGGNNATDCTRVAFSNDATSSALMGLSVTRYSPATATSGTTGYISSGYDNTPTTYHTSTDAMRLETESTYALSASLAECIIGAVGVTTPQYANPSLYETTDSTIGPPIVTASITDAASSGAGTDASFIYASSDTETGAATDTKTASFSVSVTDTEAGASTDTPASTALYAVANTETMTALATIDSTALFPVTQTDTAALIATQDFNSSTTSTSQTEAVSSTDSGSVLALFVSAATEAGAAGLTTANTVSTTGTGSEAATGTEAQSVTAVYPVSATLAATSSDSVSATFGWATAVTDTASAADIQTIFQGYLVSIFEWANNVAETGDVSGITIPITESANATDTPSQFQIVTLGTTETGAASDVAGTGGGVVAVSHTANAVSAAVLNAVLTRIGHNSGVAAATSASDGARQLPVSASAVVVAGDVYAVLVANATSIAFEALMKVLPARYKTYVVAYVAPLHTLTKQEQLAVFTAQETEAIKATTTNIFDKS